MSNSPIPAGMKRDSWYVGCLIFCLEVVDFVALIFEPIFKWLPILGLLYVLVPYYNQIAEDEDWGVDDDDDDDIPNYDMNNYNDIDWNH